MRRVKSGVFAAAQVATALSTITGATATTAGLFAAAGLVSIAHADARSVEQYWIMVAKDNSPLKAADGNIYYAVRVMKAGELLRVDGEAPGGWLRAEYPPGTKAYVKADEGSFDEGAKTVRLTKPSNLMAANVTGSRPWWPLLDKTAELPAGTVLGGAEVIKASDGTVEGFLVNAPAGSRGFIRSESIRRATPEEVAAHTAATTPPAPAPAVVATPAPTPTLAPAPSTPAPAAAPAVVSTPVATTATTPAAAPESSNPAISTSPAEAATIVMTNPPASTPTSSPSAAAPTATPAPTPAPKVEATVTGTETVTTTTTTTPAGSRPVTTTTVDSRPLMTQRIDDLNVLRDLFDRSMRSASAAPELDTVIAEFNRKIDSLGTGGVDGNIRTGLTQRVEALRLRKEVIETRSRLDNTGMINDRMSQIRVAMEQVQKQAIYTIVGRMLPSTVYDGQRGLPLMYRVETADQSSSRTIGYIVPREGMDLLSKVGKVVGILGEPRFDPALGLAIIAPLRIDELQVVGGQLVPVPDGSGVSPATPTGQPVVPLSPQVPPVTQPGQPQSGPGAVPAGQQPLATPGEQPEMDK